ncbi:MAG TPA: hypothetical protein ENH29_00060 [Bacteroidetes bacterium]|nr:hypothetical protein [Bacteroidota bacterium]
MANITIQISQEELSNVLDACNILQSFLGKIVSPNELYQEKFLIGLKEAEAGVRSKKFVEVKSFEEFID